MIYVRAAKPQKSKKSYLHKGTRRREESFLARELRASSFILPVCSFIRGVRVSRSHARVCHLRGKPVYAFCEPRLREECWFLRYILGNLTYIIIRVDELTVLQTSLAHASYTKLSLSLFNPLTWNYIELLEENIALRKITSCLF